MEINRRFNLESNSPVVAIIIHEYFHKTGYFRIYLREQTTTHDREFFNLYGEKYHGDEAAFFDEILAHILSDKLIRSYDNSYFENAGKDGNLYKYKLHKGILALYPTIKQYFDDEISKEETLHKLISEYKHFATNLE